MINVLELAMKMSMDKASNALSKILKNGTKIEMLNIEKKELSEITESIPIDKEVSGAYINMKCDRGQMKFLFISEIKTAMRFTDLFLKFPEGKTTEYNVYVESAIAEIGNILSSSISNVMTGDFEINLIPEPPIVIRDFSGNLLEYLILDNTDTDIYMMIKTIFRVVSKELDCYLFLLPDKQLLYKQNKK
jgi:chemotaxis protein CheY-P-specific phosphatase CheC